MKNPFTHFLRPTHASFSNIPLPFGIFLASALTVSMIGCTGMQPNPPPPESPPPPQNLAKEYGIEQVPPPAVDFTCPNGPNQHACQILTKLYAWNKETWQLSYGSTFMKDPNVCKWDGVECDEQENLIALHFVSRGITRLPKGAFADLPFLRELNLKENKIAMIPQDAFSGTPSLEKLDLSVNQFTVVPKDALAGLSSLKELTFEHCQLQAVEPSSFVGLSSLRLLNLENNQLTEVPTAGLSGLKSLKELNIKKNQITIVRNRAFAGLTLLEDLYLSENPIVQIEETAFAGLKNLDTLALVELTALTSLPDGLFKENPKLRRLNLDRSNKVQLSTLLCSQLSKVEIDPEKLCRSRP